MHIMVRNFIVIFLLTCLMGIACEQSFAGRNIPSKSEVAYAKKLYILIADFDDKEAEFAQRNTGKKTMNIAAVKVAFKDKFNYTKKFYMQVHGMQPTNKFSQCHNKLLEGIYANLQYLQLLNNGLKSGESINILTSKNKATFAIAMNKYKSAVKTFGDIVKSWQKPYIKKVLPPQYTPKNNS